MPTATAALRAAIHDALIADAALTGVLGGAKIYDEPPAAAAFPYVTLGEARVSDLWRGGAFGPDGKIYGIPYDATDILIVDPVSGTASRSAMVRR